MSRDNLRPVYINATTTVAMPKLVGAPAPITQSLTSSFFTVTNPVGARDCVCYQINISTVDSAGSFFLQGSLDNSNFVDIGACGNAAGVNDNIVVEYDISKSVTYTRLRYQSSTAGTGTCSILVADKQVGGS